MAMRINTNIGALNALRHLGQTENRLETNLERLSSGRRLNRASDGPAALVISEQMQSQIASTSQAISNSETSISMLQTAEGALNEVSNVLIDLRQLAVHAANEGTNDEKMLQADQSEIDNLLMTLTQVAENTQFGTRALLNGRNNAGGVAVGDGLEFVSAEATTKPSPAEGYKVNITQIPTRAMLFANQTLQLEMFAPDQDLSFVIAAEGKNVALDVSKEKDLREKLDRIYFSSQREDNPLDEVQAQEMMQHLVATTLQEKLDEAGVNLEVFVYKPADEYGDITGEWDPTLQRIEEIARQPEGVDPIEDVLVIRHRDYGSRPSFTLTTSLEFLFDDETPANTAIPSLPGRDIEGTIGGNPELDLGEPALGTGTELIAAPGTQAEGLTVRYTRDTDDVIHQIFALQGFEPPQVFIETNDNETLVGESKPNQEDAKIDGFVHVTQGSLAFQVGPNQGQQSRISIPSTRPTDLATGIKNESEFQSLADIDVTNNQGALDAMLLIDSAINEVSTLRAKIGAFQKNALESNLNTLRIAKENLMSAESELGDADMAEEMSNFTKNQILLSSGTAMLAQANQIPQTVLQLLGNGQ